MDEIPLPKQYLSALANPLSIEMWRKMCRNASDEDLRRLRLGALESLHADGDQQWSVYVSIVEESVLECALRPA